VENFKNLQKAVRSLLMQLVKCIYQAYVETYIHCHAISKF